jgi:hypothetical protein
MGKNKNKSELITQNVRKECIHDFDEISRNFGLELSKKMEDAGLMSQPGLGITYEDINRKDQRDQLLKKADELIEKAIGLIEQANKL